MIVKSRILFIAYSGPYPFIDGKRQRTFALLKALEEDYEIDYLIVDNVMDYEVAIRQGQSDSIHFYNFNTKLTSKKELLKKAGLIFIPSPELSDFIKRLNENHPYQFVFTRYIRPVVDIPPGIRIITDIDDDFNELFESRRKKSNNWFKKLRLWQIQKINSVIYHKLLSRVSIPILVKHERGLKNGLLLENLPFQLLVKPVISFSPCNSAKILFVGKLSYKPNAEGLVWFITEVWDQLAKSVPDVELTIVSNVKPENHELVSLIDKHSEIRLLIQPEDLQRLYQQHAMAIAPIFFGGGSSIKVAEALLMGRPVVTTAFGARGFEVARRHEYLYFSDDSYQFKEFIIEILMNFQLADIQKRIHSWAESTYSFDDWKSRLRAALSAKMIVADYANNVS